MTPDFVIAVLGASLLGSLHCAAMCGGLVTAVGLGGGPRFARAAQLTFHLGRLPVYAGLGALAGAVGTAIDLLGAHAGVVRVAALVAGAVVVLLGVLGLLSSGGVRIPELGGSRWIQRLSRSIGSRWLGGARVGSPGRALLLGMSTALLPCGWLYAFVISAAATGSPSRGAVLMAAFWLGTVPALVGVGELVGRLAEPLRKHVPVISALVLVCVGLGAILHRVNIPAELLGEMHGALGEPNALGSVGSGMHCH